MAKIINLFNCILIIIIITSSNLKSEEFNSWLNEFKATAISKGISKKTVNDVMADAKFLEKVIYYDNKQPEFFEKTNVYISKRASRKAAKIAKIKFIQNKKIFLKVENRNSMFSRNISKNILNFPIAHAQGNYFTNQDSLERLEDNDQIIFKYCSEKGITNVKHNPNGSLKNIAGITNKERNVLGMMPHPERAISENMNSDGNLFFEGLKELL